MCRVILLRFHALVIRLAPPVGLSVGLLAGCMPSYDVPPRPLLPPPSNVAERCLEKARIEVVSGTASWSHTDSASTGYGTTSVVRRDFTAGGLAFYQGGERLRPMEVLEILGDDELARAYGRELDETSGAHTMYPVWRDSALLMAGGGLALTGVALGEVLSRSQEERAEAGVPITLWIGAGVAVASVLPTALASTTYKGAITHDRSSELFDQDTLLPRLEHAVNAYNRDAAARCGLAVEASVVPQAPTPAEPPTR